MSTPNNGIPYVPEDTQDPAAGLNLALDVIDALLQAAVINMSSTSPPGSPTDGDRYIVGNGATGAWTGKDGWLARYVAEGDFWQFFEPGVQVHQVLNQDDSALYGWNGASWIAIAGTPNGYTIIPENSAFTAEPGTHAGLFKLVRAAGDVLFDDDEGYASGMTFNIRATAPLELKEDGVTLEPPSGGSKELDEGMSVSVVFNSPTSADIIGQTVAA
jgi:hypothetical protein